MMSQNKQEAKDSMRISRSIGWSTKRSMRFRRKASLVHLARAEIPAWSGTGSAELLPGGPFGNIVLLPHRNLFSFKVSIFSFRFEEYPYVFRTLEFVLRSARINEKRAALATYSPVASKKGSKLPD